MGERVLKIKDIKNKVQKTTVANKLTLIRFFITPIFIFLLAINEILLGCVVFILAALTDYSDGLIARRRNEVTAEGRILDPLVDKMLIISAFVYFISRQELNIPPWMVSVIIIRELIVMGVRSLGLVSGVLIPSTDTSKLKTFLQTSAIIFLFCILLNEGFATRFAHYAYFVMLFITIITVLSGVEYMLNNRRFVARL